MVGVVRAAAIGIAALIVLTSGSSSRKKTVGPGSTSSSPSPADAGSAAPTRAEVLGAQALAKKLVDDLERVRGETEAMIAARVQAEKARQEAATAELAAKEALAQAERRLTESEQHVGGGSTHMDDCPGTTSLLGRTVQQVVGLCLVAGLLLATGAVPTNSDETLQRGTAVAAAWVAYGCVMVVACLYA